MRGYAIASSVGALALAVVAVIAQPPRQARASEPCDKGKVGWGCSVNLPDQLTLGAAGGYGGGIVPAGKVYGTIHPPGSLPVKVGNLPAKNVKITRAVWLDHTPNPASGHWTGPVAKGQGSTGYVNAGSDYWRACTGGPPFICTPWFK